MRLIRLKGKKKKISRYPFPRVPSFWEPTKEKLSNQHLSHFLVA